MSIVPHLFGIQFLGSEVNMSLLKPNFDDRILEKKMEHSKDVDLGILNSTVKLYGPKSLLVPDLWLPSRSLPL